MNLNRKLTRSTYLSCGGDSAQLRFSYSYCATSCKNRFLSSALPLPQTLQWPPHRPELPHKRCLSAFSCHSSVSDFFFLLSDFLSWVDSGRGNLTWDPNLKWEMGALNGFFSFLFCYCPMEFGALTISNFLIFFSQTYELNICRVKAKSPGDLTNPRSFLFSVRFSVVFLRESTGYQLASRSRDKYALPNE